MSKLLPVGAYVLVCDPGLKDERGEQIIGPRDFYAVVRGYDMFHTKYEIGFRFMGWSEWLFTKGGSWTSPSWCVEVTVEEAHRLPERST